MAQDVAAMKSVLESKGADVTRLAVVGASIGANVAFNYAASDSDVKTAVLLSPGLDYRGLNIVNTRFSKPFLVVASNDDVYSANSAQELKNRNPSASLLIYQDAGHGTNMFVKNDLAPKMLEWLNGLV